MMAVCVQSCYGNQLSSGPMRGNGRCRGIIEATVLVVTWLEVMAVVIVVVEPSSWSLSGS